MVDNKRLRRSFYVWRRRPDLSREEAQRHWREVHGPMVQGYAKLTGLVRYVQMHTVDSPAATAPQRDDMPLLEAFDGIPEMTSDPESGTGTPEQRQRASDEMLADTRHFIDLERSTLFTVEELIFVDE